MFKFREDVSLLNLLFSLWAISLAPKSYLARDIFITISPSNPLKAGACRKHDVLWWKRCL